MASAKEAAGVPAGADGAAAAEERRTTHDSADKLPEDFVFSHGIDDEGQRQQAASCAALAAR
jgi:hypothetical protein